MSGDLDALAARWGHAYLLGYARDRWIAVRRDSLHFIASDTLAQLAARVEHDAATSPAPPGEDPASAAGSLLADVSDAGQRSFVVQAAEAIIGRLAQRFMILADLRDLFPGWHIDYSAERDEWTARRPGTIISHGSLSLFIGLTLARTSDDEEGREAQDGEAQD